MESPKQTRFTAGADSRRIGFKALQVIALLIAGYLMFIGPDRLHALGWFFLMAVSLSTLWLWHHDRAMEDDVPTSSRRRAFRKP